LSSGFSGKNDKYINSYIYEQQNPVKSTRAICHGFQTEQFPRASVESCGEEAEVSLEMKILSLQCNEKRKEYSGAFSGFLDDAFFRRLCPVFSSLLLFRGGAYFNALRTDLHPSACHA
jgi:hypothetical protein